MNTEECRREIAKMVKKIDREDVLNYIHIVVSDIIKDIDNNK